MSGKLVAASAWMQRIPHDGAMVVGIGLVVKTGGSTVNTVELLQELCRRKIGDLPSECMESLFPSPLTVLLTRWLQSGQVLRVKANVARTL